MLKRQRPVTPPPSFLGDLPSFLPDGPIRPLQPSHSVDPAQPCSKRQRIQPPPMDGALRGWLVSEPTNEDWESDGEEDLIEDVSDVPPSITAHQYKDANSLLHDLHVLHQHRLLFSHSSRDRCSTHLQDPPAGERAVAWTDASAYHPAPTHDKLASRGRCIDSAEAKALVEEVYCVRQHYGDANRMLGSLFLSRRREVERMAYPNS